MPDIKHSIQIGAAPQLVHPLVASADGFSRWWTSDVTEDKTTGTIELGFFNRATVYGLHPIQIAAPRQAHWLCHREKSGAARGCSSIWRNKKARHCFDSPTPIGRQRRTIS
jgi:hypothetical protein